MTLDMHFAAAQAQEPAVLAPHPSTQEEGMWLPMDAARAGIECLEVQPHMENRIRLITQALTLRTQSLSAYTSAVVSYRSENDALRASLREAVEERRERDQWYRNGWFGFAAGVVATGIVVSVVALAL